MTQSTYVYPMEYFDEVIRWAHEIQPKLAPTVEIVVVGITTPLLPEEEEVLEEEKVGGPVLVVHGLTFAETREEASEALAPFETCPVIGRTLVREVAHPTSLTMEYAEQRRANPEGYRYAVDNAWISAGVGQAVPALRDAFATLPTKESFSLWFGMAPLRELPDMALSLQADLYFASYVLWKDEADDEVCRAWLAEQMRRIEPVSEGLFLADSDFTKRPAKFISDANWERLEKLRAHYDPNGLFHAYLAEPGTSLNVNFWSEGE
jgi:FAD/FMN-containing dehydrogenase